MASFWTELGLRLPGSVPDAIEEVNRAFMLGIRQGDAADVAKVYTVDAVLLPPNSELIRGRKGIEQFWRVAIEMGVKEVVLTTEEFLVSGRDIVSELGTRSHNPTKWTSPYCR